MILDHLDRRQPTDLVLLQPLGEHRGLQDAEPDVETDADQHDAEQERDPPAPRRELVVGEEPAHDVEEAGAEDQAERHPQLREAGHETASLLVAPLHREQHRAAPLTTDGDALHQPQQHEQQRGRLADRVGTRQYADQRGGDTHHQQRDDQRRLAADAVTPVAEDEGSDRACGEADGVGRERLQPSGVRRGLREEQRRKDERGGGVVEEEVVPLDGGPDRAGERGPADQAFLVAGALHLCGGFQRLRVERHLGLLPMSGDVTPITSPTHFNHLETPRRLSVRCRCSVLAWAHERRTHLPRRRHVAGSTSRSTTSRPRRTSTAACSAGRSKRRPRRASPRLRHRPARRPGGGRPQRSRRAVRAMPVPAVWNTYVAVDDIDATCAAVERAGGQVIDEPADAGQAGRWVNVARSRRGRRSASGRPGRGSAYSSPTCRAPGTSATCTPSDPAAAQRLLRAGLRLGVRRPRLRDDDPGAGLRRPPRRDQRPRHPRAPGHRTARVRRRDRRARRRPASWVRTGTSPSPSPTATSRPRRPSRSARPCWVRPTTTGPDRSPLRDPQGAVFTASQFTPPE